MTQVLPVLNSPHHTTQKSHDTAAACCEQAALAHKQASKCCAMEDEKGAMQHAKMAQIYVIQALAHGEEVIQPYAPAPEPTLQQS
ncbi:MAG TPA: hypothetical protein VGD04_07220 [Methylophilus sp.]